MEIQEISSGSTYKPNKSSKHKKKVKRRLFWIKSILILILTIITVVLLALSPLFNITSIDVQGSQHYKTQDIIDTTGLELGVNGFRAIGSNLSNIFLLRYGNSEIEILKNYPYVKNALVKFILPNKVEVSLVERKPIGIVPFFGSYLLVDNEACVMEALDKNGDYTLPLIKGLKFESFELGQAIKMKDDQSFAKALKVIESINGLDKNEKFKISDRVNFVDANDPDKVLILYDNRITVNMGDLSELDYRISFLRQILQNNLNEDDEGYLDFTGGQNPSFTPKE